MDYAPGNISQTHPNEAQLIAPPNDSPDGGPQPGGLSRITVTYMCQSGHTATDDIDAATFGVSCYNTPDEKTDFIDQGNCTPVQDPPELTGEFCKEFLTRVRRNGSGKTRKGQLIQTLGTKTFHVVTVIKGADSTPVVADPTVSRDRSIIPRGGIHVDLDLDPIRTGLLANDIGDDIVGYRIDLYRGFGKAVCDGWPNPIRLGKCSPANDSCPGF